ncbi:hypothetical protein ACTOB_003668 [Actinoplanes oblitus]|uniref:Uncharacterized protein n=1 Tax=Actinoplanes oblitus TaxID=3040509 RepID=A0ABY8WQ15_9ACTN|nr:hypothetical protein [Actinoplanes oblitus]WIM99994.1 hypothetical protein ACTOB_003668 [Actinoplanes oblitus]
MTTTTSADQTMPASRISDDDSYYVALRAVSTRAETAKAAMLDAHLATTAQQRTAALTTLHTQLRTMAGIINAELSGLCPLAEQR